MILRLIIILSFWLLGSLNICWKSRSKKLITNLIIYNNYTQNYCGCQKNRDKFAKSGTNCVNYTHNFRECQKNVQKC